MDACYGSAVSAAAINDLALAHVTSQVPSAFNLTLLLCAVVYEANKVNLLKSGVSAV